MRRAHRRAHARIWMALAVLLPLVIVVAMAIRQQGPLETRAERIEAPSAEAADP